MSLAMEPEHRGAQSSLSPLVVMDNPKFTPGAARHPAHGHLHGVPSIPAGPGKAAPSRGLPLPWEEVARVAWGFELLENLGQAKQCLGFTEILG